MHSNLQKQIETQRGIDEYDSVIVEQMQSAKLFLIYLYLEKNHLVTNILCLYKDINYCNF